MSAFPALLRKEFLLEFRQKHALAGIALYVLATVFTCYLALQEVNEAKTWGALLWITGIFTAFNAMQKTFLQDGQGTQLYLYTLAPARQVILAKTVYNALLVATLNVASLLFFFLFFGSEAFQEADPAQFLLGLVLGSTGLGIALTFISGLAYRSGSGLGLVAILGFPVVIPLMITIVRYTTLALEGAPMSENGLNLLVLGVLNATSLVLSLVLFPYLWRE